MHRYTRRRLLIGAIGRPGRHGFDKGAATGRIGAGTGAGAGAAVALTPQAYLPYVARPPALPNTPCMWRATAHRLRMCSAAVALAGGIERFIGPDDAVVLKPNGQWPLQGYTHTQCLKTLIDLILSRPGGFAGEIVIAEHVHRDPPRR